MPYLQKEDLKQGIRDYRLNSITDGDDDIVIAAINSAVDEAAALLTRNDMKRYDNGRPTYDTTAIFSAEGSARNALLLTNTITIAIWYLVGLCNSGYNYEKAESRYDRAVASIKELSAGDMNSPTLPRITTPPAADKLPFRSGSRCKFNHE